MTGPTMVFATLKAEQANGEKWTKQALGDTAQKWQDVRA
jgi:hypothetical protein